MNYPILSVVALSFCVIIATSCREAGINHTPSNETISVAIKDTTRLRTMPATDTTPQKGNSSDNTWLLVPGMSAGKTYISQDAAIVYKMFGKPDDGDAAMQKAVAVWYSNHDPSAHSTAIYTVRDTGDRPAARVMQIRVTSPSFKTKEGIHAGSSLTAISQNFDLQKTEMYKDNGRTFQVYDSKSGIAFEVAGDNICSAIVIHKAGQVSNGTYLKFRFN